MLRSLKLLFCAAALVLGSSWAAAYEVPILDSDYSRQICSGMWGNSKTFINVTFDNSSQGQLAMVIYEWKDSPYLGKITSDIDDFLPQKTYICTSDAVRGGFCDNSQLGRFILDLPEGKAINDTSFWSARVAFSSSDEPPPSSDPSNENVTTGDLWDNPAGNPTPPASEYDTPPRARGYFRRSALPERRQSTGALNPSPSGILVYKEPIQYQVRKTGYYCVAVVPVTVLPSEPRDLVSRQNGTDVHPSYQGKVHFQNTFNGQLPATDYPKVTFYFVMLLVYVVFGAAWGWMCYRHRSDILPIQYYLSFLIGFLVIEMMANLTYYRYLNAHGKGAAATVFLFVVAILDAGRNSLSFFMLLVVSLGLSVVKDDLGPIMRKCQILAAAHFVFGVLYAVGIVELEFESTSALILLLFVIPLAFTLSGFLMWILYSLNATMSQLKARKQHYKFRMFQRLHWILLFVVLVVAVFFVVSSLSFSGRLAEDYAAKTWKVRWWLLDGWLSLLYFVAFAAIAYLWSPSENNRRLMMSDELAQDEEDAEDYEFESIEQRTLARHRDDDEATLVNGPRSGPISLNEEHVVFEIGDEDAHDLEDDDDDKPPSARRPAVSRHEGGADEREGLIAGGKKDHDD